MANTTTKGRATQRRARFTRWPGDNHGLLRLAITKGRKETVSHYFVRRFEADWGIGVEVQKLDDPATVYHVNIDEMTARATCDCMGHEAHGHCRHADALAALHSARRLFGGRE